MADKVTVSVVMEQELRDKLQAISDEEGRKLSAQIRYICKKFVEEQEKEA